MHNPTWWKQAIVHQIYPRSYQDSTGSGTGDLRGIVQRLDYLASLGVDTLWLNPVYPSPNDDNGYDVSDYRGIHPDFGTMDDFDELLAGMHERGLKLVMDLVLNHSSDEHPWFVKSRSGRDNPYRDYYHWWPAEKGTPPDRYSYFDVNDDGWAYEARTDSYYLHYFSRKQPDLNWHNPKVREEVWDIMRFWLDKGANGLRLDAFQFVGKDTSYPELPADLHDKVIKYYGMRPEVHEYLREMNDRVMRHYDAFTVAEGAGSTLQDAVDLSHPERRELDMVYHFEIADYAVTPERFDLVGLKALFTKWDEGLAGRGWNSIYLGNHDVPRMVSKYGNDRPEWRALSTKCLNTLLFTMRGTTYTYYGDELGMTNMDMPTIDQYRDIAARTRYQTALQEGRDMDEFMAHLNRFSRDNGRTPMQWTDGPGAGFTKGTPWLAINPNHATLNVNAQEADPDSCLHHFRKLAGLRKNNPVLVYGDYRPVRPDHPQLFAYERILGDARWLVAMNWSERSVTFELPAGFEQAQLVIGNYPSTSRRIGTPLTLRPWQATVLSAEGD